MIPAPKGPIKRPKKPLINEPNKGKKTIFKYIFRKLKVKTDRVGFEPTVLWNTLVFKTSTLNHSIIYPIKITSRERVELPALSFGN